MSSKTKDEKVFLGLVSAAIAGEASFVEILDNANETTFRFDGLLLTQARLESLVSEEAEEELVPLVDGLDTVLETEPPRIVVESWSGEEGARLKISSGSGSVETISKCPWKSGDPGNRIRVQYAVGLNRSLLLTGSSTEARPAIKKIREYCRYAGASITINEAEVDDAVDLGECLLWVWLRPEEDSRVTRLNPRTPKAKFEHREGASGTFSAVLGLEAEFEGLVVVVRGVEYPIEIPVLEDIGFSGVVACADLMVEGGEVVEDDAFESFLSGVEDDVIRCTELLLDNLAELNQEQRDRVFEAVGYLVDLSRESQDYEGELASVAQAFGGTEVGRSLYRGTGPDPHLFGTSVPVSRRPRSVQSLF